MGDIARVQARKWQLTINNPIEHGFDHETIKNKLSEFRGLVYWCLCDEEGDECETLHTHVYFQLRSACTADRVNNLFPSVHREIAHGTAKQNREYVAKDGEKFNKGSNGSYDYEKDGKRHAGVNYGDTFEEGGVLPDERQGKSKDAEVIVNMIRDGASDTDIVDAVSSAFSKLEHIQLTRSLYHDEPFKTKWRDLHTVYIFGKTGLGKTKMVMDTHGYQNVYRVTDYKHYPFDDYNGEDVLMLEEYRSSFPIGDILKYLDGYPLRLSARFKNKQACFTKVYIVTNEPPEAQYRNVDIDSRDAFWRRVHEIREFWGFEKFSTYSSLEEFIHRADWVRDAKEDRKRLPTVGDLGCEKYISR